MVVMVSESVKKLCVDWYQITHLNYEVSFKHQGGLQQNGYNS